MLIGWRKVFVLATLALLGVALGGSRPARAAFLGSDFPDQERQVEREGRLATPSGGRPEVTPAPTPSPPRSTWLPPHRIFVPPPPPPPPPPPTPTPTPKRGDEVAALLRRVTVGSPYSYGGLTLYTLRLSGHGGTRLLTTDEALASGSLVIRESDEATVRRLVAENRGDHPILLLAGECVAGGRQDRLLAEDVILAPGATATLAVYCVERERWDGPTVQFKSGGLVAAPALREAAASGAAQDRVWEIVREDLAKGKVESSSQALRSLGESRELAAQRAPYLKCFRPVPQSANCGVATTTGAATGA